MSKTVLVTGANRGIGLALTQQFAQRGDRVIGVCRKSSAELEATGARVEAGVDVTDQAAVQKLADRLRNERIDILVANAGILERDSLDPLDIDAIRRQFEVNTLGPLIVVRALRDSLTSGAKVGLMTSRMGSMQDNTSGGYYGYRASKAALNAIGKSLVARSRAAWRVGRVAASGVCRDRDGRWVRRCHARAGGDAVDRAHRCVDAGAVRATFQHANGDGVALVISLATPEVLQPLALTRSSTTAVTNAPTNTITAA